MATIAENIQTLRSIKSDIKNAITNKGGSVGNDFKTYAHAITDLPSGGGGTEIEDALVMGTLSVYSNDRISRVGSYAFYSYSNLTSINLPLCEYIGTSALAHCSSLLYIYLPNCRYMNNWALQYCSALQSIDLPNCSYIGNACFTKCIKLISVHLPLCEYVSGDGFFGCYSLQSIDLPKCSLVSDYAFANCSSLQLIKLANCIYLGNQTFNRCTNLTQVYLNSVSKVTTIQSNTFSNYSNLTSVYVPSSLVDAFKTAQYWSSMSTKIVAYREPLVYSAKSAGSSITVNEETVTLEQGDNITLDYPNEITSVKATDNTALTYIQIPNTVTQINGSAFKNCYYLTNINIPNTITDIKPQAFRDCVGLISITIPENVKNIYDFAFLGCIKLSDFNYNGTKAQWASITLGTGWKDNAPFTVVHCTDGDVNIL